MAFQVRQSLVQVTRAVLGPNHICSWDGFQRDSVCIEDAELIYLLAFLASLHLKPSRVSKVPTFTVFPLLLSIFFFFFFKGRKQGS